MQTISFWFDCIVYFPFKFVLISQFLIQKMGEKKKWKYKRDKERSKSIKYTLLDAMQYHIEKFNFLFLYFFRSYIRFWYSKLCVSHNSILTSHIVLKTTRIITTTKMINQAIEVATSRVLTNIFFFYLNWKIYVFYNVWNWCFNLFKFVDVSIFIQTLSISVSFYLFRFLVHTQPLRLHLLLCAYVYAYKMHFDLYNFT